VADINPLCVDVERGAEMLGLSASVLRGLIDQGLIPIIKFPSASAKHQGEKSRRVLLAVSDLEKFVEAHRVVEPR
jgi:hypothetical protein